jgi:hypothetical protein
MFKSKLLTLSLGLFIFLAASALARGCGCLAIDEELVPCSGCTYNFYTAEFCGGGGCIYGEYCYVSGHSQCCLTDYQTLNVFTGDCDPQFVCDGCGDVREHAASHKRRAIRSVSPELAESALGEPILVPDRCKRTYGVVFLEGSSLWDASSPETRVPSNGGL